MKQPTFTPAEEEDNFPESLNCSQFTFLFTNFMYQVRKSM